MPASKQKPTKKKLTPKQRLFVAEYINKDPRDSKNATQAAIDAGFSPKTATATASRLLTYVNIKAAIEDALRAQERRIEITADRILQELALIAFSDPRHYMEIMPDGTTRFLSFDEMPEGASRAVKGIRGTHTIREVVNTKKDSDKENESVILHSSIEYTHHDKMKALELLGKNKDLFTDKLKVEGGPFVIVKRDYAEDGDE